MELLLSSQLEHFQISSSFNTEQGWWMPSSWRMSPSWLIPVSEFISTNHQSKNIAWLCGHCGLFLSSCYVLPWKQECLNVKNNFLLNKNGLFLKRKSTWKPFDLLFPPHSCPTFVCLPRGLNFDDLWGVSQKVLCSVAKHYKKADVWRCHPQIP